MDDMWAEMKRRHPRGMMLIYANSKDVRQTKHMYHNYACDHTAMMMLHAVAIGHYQYMCRSEKCDGSDAGGPAGE